MAINIKDVQPKEPTNVERIEQVIDAKLSNENVRNSFFRGHPDPAEQHYALTVTGIVLDYEKDILKSRYANAGWGRMEIVNSEENGERPGMIGIWLYPHPKSEIQEKAKPKMRSGSMFHGRH
jgi:hypothetical protein